MAAAYADSAAVSVACLKALTALMTKQPDLLDERGSDLAIALSRDGESEEVLVALFAWVQECCTMHEANRYVPNFRFARSSCPEFSKITFEYIPVCKLLDRRFSTPESWTV